MLHCSNGDGRAGLAIKDTLELVVEKVSEKMKPELRAEHSRKKEPVQGLVKTSLAY